MVFILTAGPLFSSLCFSVSACLSLSACEQVEHANSFCMRTVSVCEQFLDVNRLSMRTVSGCEQIFFHFHDGLVNVYI